MIVYVAMINDRHTDPTPYVFSTAEEAIAYAFEYATDCAARHDCAVVEQEIDGWLYYARYCTEGDDVWVLERAIDGLPPVDGHPIPEETP